MFAATFTMARSASTTFRKFSIKALRAARKRKAGSRLDKGTLKAYKDAWLRYRRICTESLADDPGNNLQVDAIIYAATQVCEIRGNAAGFSWFVSAVRGYATLKLGLQDFSHDDRDEIRKARREVSRSIGVRRSKTAPTGRDTLNLLASKLKKLLKNSLKHRMAFAQLCVALGFVTRPNELMGLNAATAGQCFLLKPSHRFPHGAAKIVLHGTKGCKLAGDRNPEVAFAIGTGLPSCPVRALHLVFTTYGLDDGGRSSEPLFATMDQDGQRTFSAPETWQGAPPMTASDFNGIIRYMCDSAKIPRFTARTTRHGAAVDMMCDGVDPLVIMPAGRWRSMASIIPYISLTEQGAAHIARKTLATLALGTTRG